VETAAAARVAVAGWPDGKFVEQCVAEGAMMVCQFEVPVVPCMPAVPPWP
jgi:hypothetical protein